MNYGYFDDQHQTYVITNPKTPVKWINYIGGLDFGGFIDQTGGSLICKGDPALNRIVKYLPQLPDSDFRGETCYIRMLKQNQYQLFSPFYTPTLDQYEIYECHVGMGYSKYISQFYGIKTEVIVFVPPGSKRVIRDYRITNLNNESVQLDVIPIVEYTHFDALKQFTNADWVPQTMQSEKVTTKDGQVVLLQYAFMNKDKCVNYFTSNVTISSFETDRTRFLGNCGYGTFKYPIALEALELSNYLADRGNNIAALMHHLGILEPGETKRLITQLGQTGNISQELKEIELYYNPKYVNQAFENLSFKWQEYLDMQIIQTPSKSMNSMINVFNPRQCHTTLNWSRYLSLYQLGFGARGIGVRDSAQDIMGAVIQNKDYVKTLLRKLLQVQKYDGSSFHQFNPLSMIANEGDSIEMEDRYTFYGDDHLWLILAVTSYIKEHGDIKFLYDEIPYYNHNKENGTSYVDTVLNHLKKGLWFTKVNIGSHGIPLLGYADWNDTVNLPKGAESIFNANLYGRALTEMIDLMSYLHDQESVKQYQEDHYNMSLLINKYAWDGKWYIRYLDHEGKPIGSHVNKHGKIYTNAQSWAVMSGFANQKRAVVSLDSVYKHLNTKNGIKLSFPGYNHYDPQKGGITTYPPGAKENGGIFLHANPWVIIAETMLGNGNRAFQYYDQINPANKNDLIDEFECEPYVYPQNILGNEHRQFGLARNSWLSGTASWIYQAATQYILGIRPTYQGLLIDPCIPSWWDSFSIKRKYRQAIYMIQVFNPNHQQKGIKYIKVDGSKINGQHIRNFEDHKIHHIEVMMK